MPSMTLKPVLLLLSHDAVTADVSVVRRVAIRPPHWRAKPSTNALIGSLMSPSDGAASVVEISRRGREVSQPAVPAVPPEMVIVGVEGAAASGRCTWMPATQL